MNQNNRNKNLISQNMLISPGKIKTIYESCRLCGKIFNQVVSDELNFGAPVCEDCKNQFYKSFCKIFSLMKSKNLKLGFFKRFRLNTIQKLAYDKLQNERYVTKLADKHINNEIPTLL
jgi:hypothetical protein